MDRVDEESIDELDEFKKCKQKEERRQKLGFQPQKEVFYNQLLPYHDQLDRDSLTYLAQIKANIIRSVTLQEPHGFVWINDLLKYMRLYGRSFSKEDHIYFIKLLLEVITIPDLELNTVGNVANVLTSLLKKRELISRDELVIEWRPLYDLYERTIYSQHEHLGLLLIPEHYEDTLKNFIRYARVYFSVDATQEMLEEWRPLLCPYDTSMVKGTTYFSLFLPTNLPPQHHDKGWKLWFEEFMRIWESCQNTPAWEQSLVWLFARLSNDNIGYIDWNPYIPEIFTHLLRSFNLSGGSHKVQINRSYNVFSVDSVDTWLIGMLGGNSTCQRHITQLFKAVESYYHPSNLGKWNVKLSQLLQWLPSCFIQRLYKERYKKASWETPIPDSYKLTEHDIDEFVKSITPVIMLAMFSRSGSTDAAVALQNLSLVRPELVVPPVLEKLTVALETLTEPHRLLACMRCVVSVARSIVKGGKYFPSGPTHVIPLLLNSLPGIDPNDILKCITTFQFISTFVTLIPLADCSNAVDAREDLTPEEVEVCLSTAQFEDFVLQFMDRCFALIENCGFEHAALTGRDRDNEKLNAEEGIIEIGIASTFGSVLTQCSPQIFESALDKLHSFVSSHIFETKVAGKLAAHMCHAATKTNPNLALPKFVPHFCKLILALTESEDVLKEETLDDQLLFSMLVLSEIIKCDGAELLPYADMLIKVLDRTLHLTSRKGYALSSNLLKHLLKALTLINALDFRSISKPWEAYKDVEKELPIRDWAKPGDLYNLNLKWHLPNDEELAYAQQLLGKFLRNELKILTDWVSGELTLTREELQRTLYIINDCINGAASSLPLWQGDNIPMYDSLVQINISRVTNCGTPRVNLADGSNVRETVLKVLQTTLKHIMVTCEDDTKSLCYLIKIYHTLVFFWGSSKQDFDSRWKAFHTVKKALENKLVGRKQHIRALIVDRILLQHELRLMNKSITAFTEHHRDIMFDLTMLATSHYSEVRGKAQDAINYFFRFFPYCYRAILPNILDLLKKDNKVTHEQFKGALYLCLGKKGRSLLIAHDWSTLTQLWPALVNAQHSEKPSIIKLIDHDITGNVRKNFDTFMIKFTVPQETLDKVKLMFYENQSLPKPSYEFPTDEELSLSVQRANERNDRNLSSYNNLILGLVDSINSGDLHWRYTQLAFIFLSMLVRADVPFPTPAVKLFVESLIHETLYIRKLAIGTVGAILKQLKPRHRWTKIDPPPSDNQFLQYNEGIDLYDNKVWSKTVFIDKPHVGFYNFPKPLLVYDKEQPSVFRSREELNESEKAFYDCFSKPEYLDQLLGYLSLEENKGKDKFSAKKFYFWKGLFRNFGDTFLPLLEPKLKNFVNDSQESSQRCAAEIIAGIFRGSKHWPLEKFVSLKALLEPIMEQAFNNITVETLVDWGTCSATCFENRDARRFKWILDIFLNDPLRDGGGSLTSFLQASRLYVVLGAVQQQEWKGHQVLQKLLTYLEEKHLTHSYQNVRERIGSLLCNIFMYDVEIPCLSKTLDGAPKRVPFLERILPRLEPLRKSVEEDNGRNHELKSPNEKSNNHVMNGFSKTSQEQKDAKNLLKTISKWIVGNVARIPYSAPPELFQLLPIMCLMQSETTDDELVTETLFTIVMLSHALLRPRSIDAAIQTAKEVTVTKNWHARSAISTFLQYMVFSNLFTIMSSERWVNDIKQLILKLLEDERVEVRESTAETLSGLIHCEFIKIDDELVNYFKRKACHQVTRRKQANGLTIADPEDVIIKHCGILGIAASLNAFPYDVPDFMPDLLVFLSEHLHDPQPIPATIKKTLSNFRRTHHDSWRDHKLKFTEDQLCVITDLLVSPSYYA